MPLLDLVFLQDLVLLQVLVIQDLAIQAFATYQFFILLLPLPVYLFLSVISVTFSPLWDRSIQSLTFHLPLTQTDLCCQSLFIGKVFKLFMERGERDLKIETYVHKNS